MFKYPHGLLLRSVALFSMLVSAEAAEDVSFSRQVQPILSDKYFTCHGPDAQKKDALRLDSYEGATKNRDGVLAIDPNDLPNSELIARIHDTEDPMPPRKAEKTLSDSERF